MIYITYEFASIADMQFIYVRILINKMLPAPRSYWKRTPNRLQWALFFFIFITSWPVFMSHPNINFWQYQAAAVSAAYLSNTLTM